MSQSHAARPRQAPTEGAARAGAAALARIDQQPRPKVQTSQDAIRKQGTVGSMVVVMGAVMGAVMGPLAGPIGCLFSVVVF